ncbi:hypothetical protein FDECE_4303 [Fusarium decemcellulare]|nr:hypothetical protein FDECE_4303 [Fusarium decemcellulare]
MPAHAETRPTSESTSECLATHQEQVYVEASEPEAAELPEDEMDDGDKDSAIGTIEARSTESLTLSRVLDVGTGSGLWAMEFADQYPHTKVVGTDISPVQPTMVPGNLCFEIEDCTKSWDRKHDYFDFVHLRGLTGSIEEWSDLFSQVYRHTKPDGLVESHEASFRFRSDHRRIKSGSALERMGNMFEQAGIQRRCSFTIVDEGTQRKCMEEAGFAILEERKLRMPIGSWPLDPKYKVAGEFAHAALYEDIEGYLLYLLTEIFKWEEAEVQVFLMEVRKELCQNSMRLYVAQTIVVGQKPSSESGPGV